MGVRGDTLIGRDGPHAAVETDLVVCCEIIWFESLALATAPLACGLV